MKNIIKSILFTVVVAIGLGFTSCSDFLTEQSQDLAKVQSWRDLDEVLLGDGYMHSAKVISQYGGIPSKSGEEGLDILHFMADEFDMNDSDDNDYCDCRYSMFPFYTWQQDTGVDYKFKYSGGDAQYWNDLYKRINICNMVIYMIDELSAADENDALQMERVKGEAHFLRGMCYFFLANLYAQPYVPSDAETTPGVPIKTSEIIEDIEYLRASLSDTYGQIISDFDEAVRLLDGKTAKSKYHGSKVASLLMLSRVYLYMQDWENAISYADQVLAMNDNLQAISSVSPGGNYVSLSSPETIFSMGHYVIAANFSDDSWGDDAPIFSVSEYMRNLYSDDDMRKGRYVGETHSGYYDNAFLKYNLQYPNFGGDSEVSSYCLLRTPEAYLIKAEASAYSNDEPTARQTLDKFLRTRMTVVPDLASLNGNDLIDFIREERAREFLLEGHRWFDLRRYTVCEPYPWSKTIDHAYKYYSSNYRKDLDYIDTYRLEKNDQAYTLPIPREIRQFQVSIGNNPRPARVANRVVVDDDNEDDW